MSTPNLVSFLPVVVLMCVFGSTSGLMRIAPTAFFPSLWPAGDGVDVLDLRLGFEIERGDAGVDGVGDLGVSLAHAGVDDLLRVAAGLQRAEQLAAAGHIKPTPLLGQHPADVDVPAALDAEANRRPQRRERVSQLVVVVKESRLGIDVHSRTHLGGDFRRGHAFAEQFAVAVSEEIHVRSGDLKDGAGTGQTACTQSPEAPTRSAARRLPSKCSAFDREKKPPPCGRSGRPPRQEETRR